MYQANRIYYSNREARVMKFVFITFCLLLAFFQNSNVYAGDLSLLRIVSDDSEAESFGNLSANRTTGVAPLSVLFSTDFTDDPDEGRGFHVYEYSWDFDDSSSGFWETTGKSKNEAKGGIAAHVYEQAGVYNATVTIRNTQGIVGTKAFTISVADPDQIYSGNKTTCVNPSGDSNFSGAPSGSRQISTDDLSTITQYAAPGCRILFKRGSSWSAAELVWPENSGPVTIGAYGSGSKPNIAIIGGTFLNLNYKQDWRIMDLAFVDNTKSYGIFGGGINFDKITIFRINSDGFETPIGWTHWNASSNPIIIDSMAVVECDVVNPYGNGFYLGSERLALLGNTVADIEASHVARIWQSYKGVISNNVFSGSSLNSGTGRHALKLHGPGYSTFGGVNELGAPVAGTGLLENKTEYTIISDNIFGSSGPWPVTIGPQDSATDANLKHIIFEKNRLVSQFGSQSTTAVSIALNIWAQYVTVRNNIFDGTGSNADYTGIYIGQRGVEPEPYEVEIYNNTIFRADNIIGNTRYGIDVGDGTNIRIKNNLVTFPDLSSSIYVQMINGLATNFISGGNLLSYDDVFIDAYSADPLDRDFHVNTGLGVDQGLSITVLEDFDGNDREDGTIDIGAYEND